MNLNPDKVSKDQFDHIRQQLQSESGVLAETLIRKISVSTSRSRDLSYHELNISAASEPAAIHKFLVDYAAEFIQVRNELIDLSRNTFGVSVGCDPALTLKKCSKALGSLRQAYEIAAKTSGYPALNEGIYFVDGSRASVELRFPARLVRFNVDPEELLKHLE